MLEHDTSMVPLNIPKQRRGLLYNPSQNSGRGLFGVDFLFSSLGKFSFCLQHLLNILTGRLKHARTGFKADVFIVKVFAAFLT